MFAAEDVVTVSSHAAGWHAGDFKLPVISLIVFPLRGFSSLNSSNSPHSQYLLFNPDIFKVFSQPGSYTGRVCSTFFWLLLLPAQFESNKISSKKLFFKTGIKAFPYDFNNFFIFAKHITICIIKNLTTGKSIKSKNTFKANVCRQQKLRQSSLLTLTGLGACSVNRNTHTQKELCLQNVETSPTPCSVWQELKTL